MKNQSTNNPAPGTGNPGGRPSKLNSKVIKAFKEILEDEMNVLVCTDSDLFFLLNEKLEPEDQISYRSFQRYKASALKDDEAEKKDLLHELYVLMRNMMIQQKKSLMKMLLEAKQGWSRIQWIIERKFKEWNLKYQGEVDEGPRPPRIEYRLPYINDELWGKVSIVEDRPLITLSEWMERWGHTQDKDYLERLHCR